MRTLAAGASALLLLALMPAFALLRYEHTHVPWPRSGAETASRAATGARTDGRAAVGPSAWIGAHAASPATIFQRSIALAALREIEDSIPRAAGSPPPQWSGVLAGRDPDDVPWPVAVSARIRQCTVQARQDEPCGETQRALVTVFLRLVRQDLERADVLARWSAEPSAGGGYFLVTLTREGGAWRAARIARSASTAGRPPS